MGDISKCGCAGPEQRGAAVAEANAERPEESRAKSVDVNLSAVLGGGFLDGGSAFEYGISHSMLFGNVGGGFRSGYRLMVEGYNGSAWMSGERFSVSGAKGLIGPEVAYEIPARSVASIAISATPAFVLDYRRTGSSGIYDLSSRRADTLGSTANSAPSSLTPRAAGRLGMRAEVMDHLLLEVGATVMYDFQMNREVSVAGGVGYVF